MAARSVMTPGMRESKQGTRAQPGPAEVARVRQREREGVGRVRIGDVGESEHALNHARDGDLLRRAEADDGLFHAARGDFRDLQARFGGGEEADAARLAHDEGRLDVLRVKETFDRADGRLMGADRVAKPFRDADETEAAGERGRAFQGSEAQHDRGGARGLQDSPACSAEGGIDAENDFPGAPRGDALREDRFGLWAGTRSGEPGLDLAELLRADAHRRDGGV